MQAGQEKINKFAKCAVFLFCGDEGLTARRREDYKKVSLFSFRRKVGLICEA